MSEKLTRQEIDAAREDSYILDWLYAHAPTTTNDPDTALPIVLPSREAIAKKLKEEGHE